MKASQTVFIKRLLTAACTTTLAAWAQAQYRAVILDPIGKGSGGLAIDGGEQVGNYNPLHGLPHAVLWHGDAAGYIDLNPWNAGGSWAWACHGGYQGGEVGQSDGNHAVIWHGSAESAVDLHPSGYIRSAVYGMGDGFQVGDTIQGEQSPDFAVLWRGTKESMISLNPDGSPGSFARGVYGNEIIGSAAPGGRNAGGAMCHSVFVID